MWIPCRFTDLGATSTSPTVRTDPAHLGNVANRTGVVGLLLSRNADPNRVDQYGMTALLYAASVDYGDSTVLEFIDKTRRPQRGEDQGGG